MKTKKSVISIVLIGLCAAVVSAQTVGDFEYKIEGSGVTITGYTGNVKDVIIPARINNLLVASIGDGAFRNNQLTSVIIPSNVTSIGDEAFANEEK